MLLTIVEPDMCRLSRLLLIMDWAISQEAVRIILNESEPDYVLTFSTMISLEFVAIQYEHLCTRVKLGS